MNDGYNSEASLWLEDMSDNDSEKLEHKGEINHQIEVKEGEPQGDNHENITDNQLDTKAKKGEGTVSGILLL